MDPEKHAQIWGYKYLQRNVFGKEQGKLMRELVRRHGNLRKNGTTNPCSDRKGGTERVACVGEECSCVQYDCECSLSEDHCGIGSQCMNQQIQKFYQNGVNVGKLQVVYERPEFGFGVKASSEIREGELIGEYVGEVVFSSDPNHIRTFYGFGIGEGVHKPSDPDMMMIDSWKKANLLRFVNHSCEPNAYAHVKKIDSQFRIGFYAKRDIQALEFVSIDYGPDYFKGHGLVCKCGCQNCKYNESGSQTSSDSDSNAESSEESDDSCDQPVPVKKSKRSQTSKKSTKHGK